MLRAIALASRRTLALLFSVAIVGAATAGEILVRTEPELQAALRVARPGDTVVMADGVWRDLALRWTASGTAEAPVTLRAETRGRVILSGQSFLRLGGDHQIVDGLVFRDGYAPKGGVIEFMVDEHHVANHSRVTACAIDHYNPPDRLRDNTWVVFHGRHNRLDHSHLAGKLNAAPTVIVELNDERHRENHHRIDHNVFGYRPRLGSNGGETIRIGVSTFCLFPSRTVIERNWFERCSGEVEIVSVKASDNIVRGNVFVECEGVVALRHGDRNLVEGNFFLGNNRPHTGGIRVVNEGHIIRGNHLQDLRGERFFGTLAVMNGVPGSLQNRYMPVLDVLIAGNRFFDTQPVEFGTGRDNERSVPPDRCRFEDNLIFHTEPRPALAALDSLDGISFAGNRASLGGAAPALDGFAPASHAYVKNAAGLYAGPDYDPVLPVTRDECGFPGYEPLPEFNRRVTAGATVAVPARHDALAEAVEASAPGDTLLLEAGRDYTLSRTLRLRHPLTLRTAEGAPGRAAIRFTDNKAEHPLIELQNGAALTARGLVLDGRSENGVARAGIATWNQPMIEHLTVDVADCDFVNFDSARHSAFVMRKGHFAGLVRFVNCTFATISGNALNLNAETDDTGRYNAEHVILRNCLFRDVMGAALDLYRGSNDESTTGPLLRVERCTFVNVNNVELGSVLRLTGVQDGDIRDCLFVNSGMSGRAIRMEDQRWCRLLVSHTNFSNSGRVESFYPDRAGPGLTRLVAELADPARGDYRLAPGSPLATMATDGGPLGARWHDGVLRD